MSKRKGEYPRGSLIECAACGHVCNRNDSEYPPEGTPSDKVYIKIGTRLTSMFCTTPSCECYTIYVTSSSQEEYYIKKYKASSR